MRRFLRHCTRRKPQFLAPIRKWRCKILDLCFLSLFYRRRTSLRRTVFVKALVLWLLFISGCHRYQFFAGLRHSSIHKNNCSSISCTQEREAANILCSSSKTLVETPKHSLASLHCNASKKRFRNGSGCRISLRKPYLLWTIPGTGNTWVRNLLEQATGVPTGSVYNDSSLRNIFVGEGLCDDTTLCIKAHPSTHPFELLINQEEDHTFSSPMLTFRNSVTKSVSDALRRQITFRGHCRPKWDALRSNKPITFRRAVIIDRNPLEAAFAEVQRLTLNRHGGREGSHISRLSGTFKRDVNERVWNRLCADFLRLGVDYVLAWHSYVQFVQKFGKEAVYFVRYEDLKDPEKREGVLQGMLKFLDAELLPGSLECAFSRSEDSRIRRGRSKSSTAYSRSKDNDSNNPLTLQDFLNSKYMDKPLIQWMWDIIGRVAETRGYEAPKGFMPPAYQNSNGTESLNIARAVGFPVERWYREERKMTTLESIGIVGTQNGAQKADGQKRIVSSEYLTCLKKAFLVERDNRVVVTFVGNLDGAGINDKQSVFPILLNSILWMRTAGVWELLVVCFDEEYEYVLRSLGVNTCYLKLPSQRDAKSSKRDEKARAISEIYKQRLAFVETMLRAEINVIHTDTDAVWTGNPLAVLNEYHNSDNKRSDIVASRGTFPYKEKVSWGGSTLCMGLISFRATPGVREVLRVARQTAEEYHGDDQIGLNRGLARLGLVWFAKNQEIGKIVLPSMSDVSTIPVALLSDDIVRRNCTSGHGSHSLIMHCFDKNNISFPDANTKGFMRQRGLWLLKERWLEMLTSGEHSNHSIETLKLGG